MGIFDRSSKEPFIGTYQIMNKIIICPNCGHDKFEMKDVLLNTAGMSFLGLDWANRSASALICTNCTRIEWYLNKPNSIN
jgi:predicted nucleic-acid-binding Zn-ribbon protein